MLEKTKRTCWSEIDPICTVTEPMDNPFLPIVTLYCHTLLGAVLP